MPSALKFPVMIERVVERHLNTDKLKEALQYIAASAERNKTYNFSVSIPRKNVQINPIDDGSGVPKYRYTAVLTVWKENYRSAGAVREQFDAVLNVMVRAANRMKWKVLGEVDGDKVKPLPSAPTEALPGEADSIEKPPKVIKPRTDIVLPELTDEVIAKHFGRLYNREPQIRILYDSAKQAVRTNFKERHHILFRGPAGTGKTETILGFIEFLGPHLVWKVDATTITKAGLERELVSRSQDGVLAPFLVVEEIEKVTNEQNINCLLQVMDTRGMIQRTNARDGDLYAECKIVVIATCNDSHYLRTFADGAIWSRFSLRPICKRPDRDNMRKILLRTVHETDGKEEWVDPVLTFMWDRLQPLKEYRRDYNDPRLGRALLAGGDRIMDDGPDGFFADFLACCEGDEWGEEGDKSAMT
jgi:hypothetical protein